MRDCLCGREVPKRRGDPIERGDVVGMGIEPGMRYGRVVGVIKPGVRLENVSAARAIIREFRPGDGRWPTGGYRRAWSIYPWAHDHPTSELSRWEEPVDWWKGPFTAVDQKGDTGMTLFVTVSDPSRED